MSDVTGWTVTPSCARVTLPLRPQLDPSRAAPCSTGIAKPMPMLPSELDRICELMPTSSPFVFTSAPPELPWLIGASVCRKSS